MTGTEFLVRVKQIGDCLAPRELDNAVLEGARVGHAL
jgi:hypothetical protein